MIYPYLPLYNPAQVDGCVLYRIYLPIAYLYEGWDMTEFNTKPLLKHLEETQLVSFNRTSPINDHTLLTHKNKYGWKLIVDLDDYFDLPHGHAIEKFWKMNKMDEKLKYHLSIADAVTTRTPRLAERLKGVNPNIFVIPNAVPFETSPSITETFQYQYTQKDSTNTRFGYVGGSTHLPDIKHIAPVFEKMNRNWHFTLCGYNNKTDTLNTWDFMERIASFNHHNPNYTRMNTKPIGEFMKCYDEIDVALVPLVPNSWSACKSSLKCYEAGVKMVAAIVQDCAPYTDDVPKDVVTFCNKNYEWIDAIKKHKNLSYAKEQGEKLYEWVKENRNLKKVTQLRKEIYDQIIYGQKQKAKIISIPTRPAPVFSKSLIKHNSVDRV